MVLRDFSGSDREKKLEMFGKERQTIYLPLNERKLNSHTGELRFEYFFTVGYTYVLAFNLSMEIGRSDALEKTLRIVVYFSINITNIIDLVAIYLIKSYKKHFENLSYLQMITFICN